MRNTVLVYLFSLQLIYAQSGTYFHSFQAHFGGMNFYRISDMIYENSDSYMYVFNERFTVPRYQEINPLFVVYDKNGIYKDSYWIDLSGDNKYSGLDYSLPINLEEKDFLMAFVDYKIYIFRRKFGENNHVVWDFNFPYSVSRIFLSDKIYDDKVKIVYSNNKKQLLLTTVRLSDGKMDTIYDLLNSYLSAHKNMFHEVRNFLENDTYLFVQFIRFDKAEYVLILDKNKLQTRIFPSNDFGSLISCNKHSTLLFMKQDKIHPHSLTLLNFNNNSIQKIEYEKIDSLAKYIMLAKYDETDDVFEIKLSNGSLHPFYFDHLVYLDTIGQILKKYSYYVSYNEHQFIVNSLAMKKLKLEPAFIGVMTIAGTNQIFKTDSCGQIFANLPDFKFTFSQPNCGKFEHQTDEENGESTWHISLYPNPNNGRFTLLTPGAGLLEIVAATGQILNSYEILDKKSELILNELRSGVYFARFRDERGKVQTSKLVIY